VTPDTKNAVALRGGPSPTKKLKLATDQRSIARAVALRAKMRHRRGQDCTDKVSVADRQPSDAAGAKIPATVQASGRR